MSDDLNPLAALTAAKAMFGKTTEAPALVRLVDQRLSKGCVAWLEVGAGNGRNLALMLAALASGRTIGAVAIEPDAAPGPSAVVELEPVEWSSLRVEDYRPDRAFDWINVRHSAYYFDNPLGRIAEMTGWLLPGGWLSLTHWSRECVLRRMHVDLCGPAAAAVTSDVETLALRLGQVAGFHVEGPFFQDTDLRIDEVQRDHGAARALIDLAGRGYPLRPGARQDQAEVVRRALRGGSGIGARRNGLLLVRRSVTR